MAKIIFSARDRMVLGMKDEAGRERPRASVTRPGGPRLDVLSEQGRVIYRAPSRGEGRDG